MAGDETDDDEMIGDDTIDNLAAAPATTAEGTHTLTAGADDAGTRLDKFLAEHLAGVSRARVQSLIRDGHVTAGDGPRQDGSGKIRAGESYTITIPPAAPTSLTAQNIPLTVVFEDEHLLVIDKPAGLVVHPAAGHAQDTLVNALMAHCGESLSGIGGVKRPGIVHRLDKDTSGLLVIAKSDAAHRGLSEQFAAHGADGRLVRTYEAFVWGIPRHQAGSIDANLGRSPSNRTRMAVVRGEHGRRAVTHFEMAEPFIGPDEKPLAARLRLQLETGRTHQIRVHLAHIGHPVMGDPVYGMGFKASARKLSESAAESLERLGRQALHAMELGFEHPITRRAHHFTSPRPADLEDLYRALSPKQPVFAAKPKRPRKPNVSKR